MFSDYRGPLLILVSILIGALSLLGLREHWTDQGRQEVRVEYQDKLEKQRLAYETATTVSTDRFTRTINQLRAQHELEKTALQAALDRSGLRDVHITRRVARLHDQATGSLRTAPAPEPPGEAPAGAEDLADGPSVATLIETATENYAICRQNSAQLVELQAWYEDLRAGSKAATD